MSKKNDVLKKISRLDDRFILACMLIGTIITQLYPIGLPVPIMETTRWLYDGVEEYVKPGNVIIIDNEVTPGLLYENGQGAAAVMTHIFSKPNIKIIVTHFTPESPIMFSTLQELGWLDIPSDKIYGVDYVAMPYLAGVETAYANVAEDLWTYGKDLYGTPLSDLPIMENVYSISDINFIFQATISGTHADGCLRQWAQTYNVPFGWCLSAPMMPTYMPYVPSQVLGIIGGVPGGAQYELLINKPGNAVSFTDSISLIVLISFVMIVIVNIAEKMVEKGGKNDGNN